MGEKNIYDFRVVLGVMLCNIQDDYRKNKDPLTRCELAKGYLEIGKYLYDEGVLPTEELSDSISRLLNGKRVSN